MYSITYAPTALQGIAKLKKSEPHSFKKLSTLIEELKAHPKTGTGKHQSSTIIYDLKFF